MVEWFNRHVPAWMDGTEALSHECYRVYDVVLNLIYLNDGPIVLHERGLAGRCNMSTRLFRVALSELVSAGKLDVFDGKISNKRARTELEHVTNLREKSAKGGRASAERRRKLLEINKLASTTLGEGLPSKEEQGKESKTPSAPNGAGHMDDWPEDYREQWWALYPRKVEKKAALEKLARIRKSGSVTWAVMKAGLERHVRRAKRLKPEFIKHPTTWLNGGCWDDAEDLLDSPAGEDWKKVVYG